MRTDSTYYNGLKVRPLAIKQQREGQMGPREEARGEDAHPGGGQQTESREVMKEGGAREETGGTWSMQRQVGPRP